MINENTIVIKWLMSRRKSWSALTTPRIVDILYIFSRMILYNLSPTSDSFCASLGTFFLCCKICAVRDKWNSLCLLGRRSDVARAKKNAPKSKTNGVVMLRRKRS